MAKCRIFSLWSTSISQYWDSLMNVSVVKFQSRQLFFVHGPGINYKKFIVYHKNSKCNWYLSVLQDKFCRLTVTNLLENCNCVGFLCRLKIEEPFYWKWSLKLIFPENHNFWVYIKINFQKILWFNFVCKYNTLAKYSFF